MRGLSSSSSLRLLTATSSAGKTTLPSPGEGEGETVDMSLEEQSKDLQALLRALYPRREESPSLVLVGHSMVRFSVSSASSSSAETDSPFALQGGAVVADAANSIQDSIADVLGVVVIDVVEGTHSTSSFLPPPVGMIRTCLSSTGTAIEALPGMSALIASHPKTFSSPEDAIAWQYVVISLGSSLFFPPFSLSSSHSPFSLLCVD